MLPKSGRICESHCGKNKSCKEDHHNEGTVYFHDEAFVDIIGFPNAHPPYIYLTPVCPTPVLNSVEYVCHVMVAVIAAFIREYLARLCDLWRYS